MPDPSAKPRERCNGEQLGTSRLRRLAVPAGIISIVIVLLLVPMVVAALARSRAEAADAARPDSNDAIVAPETGGPAETTDDLATGAAHSGAGDATPSAPGATEAIAAPR